MSGNSSATPMILVGKVFKKDLQHDILQAVGDKLLNQHCSSNFNVLAPLPKILRDPTLTTEFSQNHALICKKKPKIWMSPKDMDVWTTNKEAKPLRKKLQF